MSPRAVDYLIMGTSMLVTLGSGIGIGLVWAGPGPRAAEERAAAPPAAEARDSIALWEQRMLERLEARLGLDEGQRIAVATELSATRQRLEQERQAALEGYRGELAGLYGRLERIVDPRQRDLLAQERDSVRRRLQPARATDR